MAERFDTMQQLVAGLAEAGEAQCLLWFEEEGSDSLTYAAFADMAESIARGLASRSIGPGSRVVLFAENRWETAVLAGGIVRAGAAVAPVDPQFSGEVLAHVLQDADPALVLANEPQEEAAREALDGDLPWPVLFTDRDDGEGSWRELPDPDGPDPGQAAPEDTMALFYTSGTTGRPKGVPLSHANIAFQQRALIESGLTSPGDRLLLPLPLHHVYPFVVGLFAPLALRLAIIFPRAIVGPEVVRAAAEGRATIVAGVPRLYEALVSGVMGRIRGAGFFPSRLLLGLLAVSRFARRRLGLRVGKTLLGMLHKRIGPNLDIMASGGAPLDADLAWTMESLGWRVAIGYGLTETSPILSIVSPGDGAFHTVGEPLPGVELRIRPVEKTDEESDNGSGPGQEGVGEVQARGPGVFAGYRNLPDKTAEAFTEDGWYRTGDMGRMEDVKLVITGRVSTMIVTRGGENVNPDVVEQVLDRHPLLRETGVLERDGKIAVLAVVDVVAARQAGLEPEEAGRKGVNEAAKNLPSYQRPSQVAVSVNGIERTRLGKIRRHKLEDQFGRALEGAGEQNLAPMQPQEMQTADRRLLENDAAAATWSLLAERYPRRRLTPDSDMAGDLGVDSLEWLDLSMELNNRAQVELDEEDVAQVSTVRDLLRVVSRVQGETRDRPDPVANPETYLDEEDKEWLEPVVGARLGLYQAVHGLLGPLLKLTFRIRVQGLEHLDGAAGPLVIAPNHQSYLDPILLAASLPFSLLRRTHFIGWQGAAFANPVLGFLSRTAQGISIDPAKRPGTSLALGAATLERGRNLVWFPEGMRSKTGELLRFQPGLGRILAAHEARVAPVRIEGAHEALPPGRWWIKPVKISITIGEPLEAAALRNVPDDATEPCDSEAECVMRNLRQRMVGMIDE